MPNRRPTQRINPLWRKWVRQPHRKPVDVGGGLESRTTPSPPKYIPAPRRKVTKRKPLVSSRKAKSRKKAGKRYKKESYTSFRR